MSKSLKRKIQAISLIIAVILLWIPYFESRTVATVIILVNAIVEMIG